MDIYVVLYKPPEGDTRVMAVRRRLDWAQDYVEEHVAETKIPRWISYTQDGGIRTWVPASYPFSRVHIQLWEAEDTDR